jgi:hypothetical protein
VYQYCAQNGLRTLIATAAGRTDNVIHTSTSEDVPFDALAITAGPWTNDVCRLLKIQEVAVCGGPGHFVQIQPGYIPGGLGEIPPQTIFTGIGDTLETASENLAALDTKVWFSRLTDEERRKGLAGTLVVFPYVLKRIGHLPP